MKIIHFKLIFVLLPLTSLCQQEARLTCATRTPAEPLIFSERQLQEAQRTIDYQYVINIYVHILTDDNGTNAATTISQLNIDLQRMAAFFKPHNICFILLGVDYRASTMINNSMDPGNASHVAALNATSHQNTIDIFVHKNFGVAQGGNSYSIPNHFFSVVQSANFNFEHEMGHALGLYHTFETGYGQECPDGSDCSGDGDLICDTPADFPGSQNMVAAGAPCVYTGTQTTNCATFPFSDIQTYNPSTNNIMSYWASCYAQFTLLQGVRMRTAIANASIINNCLANYDTPIFAGNTNITINGDWYASAKNEISMGSTGSGQVQLLGGNTENG
ncbi:MAG: M43 family zinc metalloprotease [Ferruginibacter sp.]